MPSITPIEPMDTGGYLDEQDMDLSSRLVQYIQSPERLSSLRNNPTALLSAIYDFQAKDRMMSFNKLKTDATMAEISSWQGKPEVIVELGTFVGASAVFWGILLRRFHGPDAASKGCKVYALEVSPDMASITSDMIKLSGLDDIVEVILGQSSDTLHMLQTEGRLNTIDLLFIDHWERYYLPDTKLCEELRLFRNGTVILADNVDKPGAPEYASYVRSGGDGARGYKYTTRTEKVDAPPGAPTDLEWSTVVQSP